MRPTRTLPAVIVALAVPLALVVTLLAGLWTPTDRARDVQAAIVNNDEPVTVDGQLAPLGRQLSAELVETSDDADGWTWLISDEDTAAAGLADGTYAAVVTIPEDFSAAATSFGSDDPADARQATIDVVTADGSSATDDAVANALAASATTAFGRDLTQTYLDNVLLGFTTLSDQLGEAADGADQLADGTQELADGQSQLADGATTLAEGTTGLATGLGTFQSGAAQLATGAHTLAQGARSLADGTQGLADGAGRSAEGARGLANGTADLAAQTPALAEGTQSLADGLGLIASSAADAPAEITDGIDTAFTQLDAGLTPVEAGVQQVVGAVAAGFLTPEQAAAQITAIFDGYSTALTGAGDTLADGIVNGTDEEPGLSALVGGIQQAAGAPASNGRPATGAYELADGTAKLADGTKKLSAGAGDLADGIDQLAAGSAQLAGGADELADGASELASGTSGLASGASELSSGATQLAAGAGDLAGGLGQARDGSAELADGTGDLADGLQEAVDQVPTYDEAERTTLAEVIAAPVAAPAPATASSLTPVATLTAVALWLGALALFLAFPTLPARVVGTTRSAFSSVLGALAVPAAVAAGQGVLVGGLVWAVTDLSTGSGLGLVGLAVLAALAFAAFHQALAAWTGHVGRAFAVVVAFAVLVAGLAASAPTWLGLVGNLGPLGPGVDALATATSETAGGLGGPAAGLVVWAAGSVAFSVLAVVRARHAAGATRLAALPA